MYIIAVYDVQCYRHLTLPPPRKEFEGSPYGKRLIDQWRLFVKRKPEAAAKFRSANREWNSKLESANGGKRSADKIDLTDQATITHKAADVEDKRRKLRAQLQSKLATSQI